MIQQFRTKDQEQTKHPTNMASAYAMYLSEDDAWKIGLDYVHSNTANSSLNQQNEAVVRHYGAPAGVNNHCGIDNRFIELTVREKIAGFKLFLEVHHWLWTRPRNSVDFALRLARQHGNVSVMNYGIGLPCWQKSLLVGTKALMTQNVRLTLYQLMALI
jgi:hypothetical protein